MEHNGAGEKKRSVEDRWYHPAHATPVNNPDQANTDSSNKRTLLVLLHEGLGCAALWKSFPKSLANKTGYSVFCYSRFGYGESFPDTLPKAVTYMHQEAEILQQILEQLPKGEIILIGHSDGASIASIYAGTPRFNTDDSHPIKGLVLMAPHFFVEPISIRGIERARKLFLESDLRQRLQKYHGAQTDNAFWGWNDIWLDPRFADWTILNELSQITIATLILQGEEDEYGTMAQIEAAKNNGPTTLAIQTYPNVGHNLPLAHGEAVIEDIHHFVTNSANQSIRKPVSGSNR